MAIGFMQTEEGGIRNISSGGGYNNGAMHNGYALNALDFIRSDSLTSSDFSLSPTSGTLSLKETTPPKCIDLSIQEVSSTQDLYLQICHLDFVESPVLTIPPPVTDLDLVLECNIKTIFVPLIAR